MLSNFLQNMGRKRGYNASKGIHRRYQAKKIRANEGGETDIIVNLNNNYFRFVDVPGDGNCFFHTVLKVEELKHKFNDVSGLRKFIRDKATCLMSHDVLLMRLFEKCHVNFRHWSDRIVCLGEWATTFDMMVLVYLTNWNIVTVGNYLNGFIINDINLNLRTYLHVEDNFCGVNVIHVLFHRFGSPLEKISQGNHFAFLQPIVEPKLSFSMNTINLNSSSDRTSLVYRWTKNRQLELYRCYCIAKKRNLPISTGLHNTWMDRNHDSPHFHADYLIKMKERFEVKLTESDRNDIMLHCCEGGMTQGLFDILQFVHDMS